MGRYINPTDRTKEEWLREFATEIDAPYAWEATPPGQVQLCWVDNIEFTAVGVMYSSHELAYWMEELREDFRPRKWYIAPAAEVEKVTGGPI